MRGRPAAAPRLAHLSASGCAAMRSPRRRLAQVAMIQIILCVTHKRRPQAAGLTCAHLFQRAPNPAGQAALRKPAQQRRPAGRLHRGAPLAEANAEVTSNVIGSLGRTPEATASIPYHYYFHCSSARYRVGCRADSRKSATNVRSAAQCPVVASPLSALLIWSH